MQLLNVLFGGTLLQHLPVVPETEPHQLGLGTFAERKVRMAPGSRLHAVLGPTATVNCHHHQALDRIAPALTPSAWAEDGVVEGVEDAARRFCLAVQWHPETGEDGRLFEELVAAAGSRLG
jgi:putative glutamine amidotransferase